MSPYDTDFEEPPLVSVATNPSSLSYTPFTNNNNTNDRFGIESHGSFNSIAAATSLNRPSSNTVSGSRPISRPAQFARDGFTALGEVKDSMLPGNTKPWVFLGLWIAFLGLMIGLSVRFYSQIFQFLETLAAFIKGLGPLGPPVIMLCLFATTFPPVIGYSSVITMAGYVYGFLFGFTIVFISALAGAIVCFYFCRRWFKPQVRKLLAKNKNFKSVLRTVERKGFRLLVLIRLAPYPFNVMNALLSATHVSLKTFILATALSLSKLTLHVYVGSTLSSLTGDEGDDGDGGDQDPSKGHGKKVKIVLMVLSIFLGFGVGGYVWMVTKREIAITEASRLERRRRRRREQSLRRELDSDQFANNNGIELTDHHRMHHIPDVDLTSRELSVDGMPGNNGTGRDDSRQTGYRDEEDDVHERQSLFGSLGFGQNQRQQQGDDWRNVGANIDSSTDSEDSDFLDDDDEEEEEEREGNEADIMNALERGENFDQQEQDDGGALDFSAHHDGLINSPWQDDEEEEEAEVDNAGLLNPNKGSNVWW